MSSPISSDDRERLEDIGTELTRLGWKFEGLRSEEGIEKVAYGRYDQGKKVDEVVECTRYAALRRMQDRSVNL